MKKFMKKFFGFSLGPIIGAVISFVTIPVTTYFIVPEEFGKASMFSIVQALVMTFVYLGIDQSYTKEYHYIRDKKKLFQNALLLPLLCSLLIATLIFVFSSEFSQLLFDSRDYNFLANLFSVLIISSVIERFLLLSIRMDEKALEYSFFNVFLKLVIFIVTLGLILLGKRTFLTIIYATVFGQLLGDMILIIKYRKLFILQKEFIDKELLKKMLLFGLPLIIAASVGNLLNSSGRFFLRGYSTYKDLGIYTAAIKIANILQIVQLSFTSFWVPTAYRWHKEKKNIKHFSFISDLLLLILTLGFFFILFFKKYIVLILSSNYSDAQYIAGLVALYPILYTLSETTTLGIVFSGKSYYNVWISIISLIPNVILNILLTPRFGTIGAAISTASAYIVFCLSRTYFSRKCGFVIKSKKQIAMTLMLFVAALVNISQNHYVIYITIFLFILSIIIQISTFTTIVEIKNNNNEWDFD